MRAWLKERARHLFLLPQGEERCTYTAPISDDRCVRWVRHRGVCYTRDCRNRMSAWYGINFRSDDERHRHG